MMSVSASEIEKQARLLSPEERVRLVQVLIESLRDSSVPEIEAAWAREISARLAAYERGELKTYAAEEVFGEAKRLALISPLQGGQILTW